MTVRPTLPTRVVAPMTATDCGSNMQSSRERWLMIDSMRSRRFSGIFYFAWSDLIYSVRLLMRAVTWAASNRSLALNSSPQSAFQQGHALAEPRHSAGFPTDFGSRLDLPIFLY